MKDVKPFYHMAQGDIKRRSPTQHIRHIIHRQHGALGGIQRDQELSALLAPADDPDGDVNQFLHQFVGDAAKHKVLEFAHPAAADHHRMVPGLGFGDHIPGNTDLAFIDPDDHGLPGNPRRFEHFAGLFHKLLDGLFLLKLPFPDVGDTVVERGLPLEVQERLRDFGHDVVEHNFDPPRRHGVGHIANRRHGLVRPIHGYQHTPAHGTAHLSSFPALSGPHFRYHHHTRLDQNCMRENHPPARYCCHYGLHTATLQMAESIFMLPTWHRSCK